MAINGGHVAGSGDHVGDHNLLDAAVALKADKSANLSDLASAATARTNLGLGTAATTASTAYEVAGAAAAEQTRALAAEALLAPKLLTTTTQTSTTYTLALADGSTTVEMNNASANTLTVPPNSTVAFPVGTVIGLRQYGAGQTTVAAGAGVTIRSRGTVLKLAGQYAEASIVKRATDEWVLTGDLVA